MISLPCLVAAQDDERRKLERDVHDGAQQHLVALAVKARLASTLVGMDPGEASRDPRVAAGRIRRRAQTLRDLARGTYPPLLADQWLGAALEAQARASSVQK